MPVPISQAWTVASYVLGQKFRGNKRYPLVLMLEPLFRCNLACAGCGKIQYPDHVLNKRLTPEQCWAAADECGAPMVSIPGGEPLIHPEIDKIVEGLVARKKYIYLCTNALLLKRKIDLFKPTKYLTFSVHMDGLEPEHDAAVCLQPPEPLPRHAFTPTTSCTPLTLWRRFTSCLCASPLARLSRPVHAGRGLARHERARCVPRNRPEVATCVSAAQ